MFSCSAYKKHSTSHFRNHKVDKEIALLSQATLYLSEVLEKQAPVPDSAPSCNSLPSLQSDRYIFFGSFAAPAPRHREKCTVRSPLLSNTGSCCCRSFLHCVAAGSHLSNFAPCHEGPSAALAAKGWGWLRASQPTGRNPWCGTNHAVTGISENIRHTSCPTWIPELFPRT